MSLLRDTGDIIPLFDGNFILFVALQHADRYLDLFITLLVRGDTKTMQS